MQRDARMLREALKAMRDHLAAQIANLLPLEPEIRDAVRPVRQVHDGARERLVQRRIGVAPPRQPRRRLQRVPEARAQRDADVLGRVVVVDVQVARGAQPQAPARVLGQRVQHMVQEADARRDTDLLRGGGLRGVLAGVPVRGFLGLLVGRQRTAVKVQAQVDLRLVGVAGDGGAADGAGSGHDRSRWNFWEDMAVYISCGCSLCAGRRTGFPMPNADPKFLEGLTSNLARLDR